jgi:hypothetical protein
MAKSVGPCEVCGEVRECYDVPTRLLPSVELKPKSELGVRYIYRCPNCHREVVGIPPTSEAHGVIDGLLCPCFAEIGLSDFVRVEVAPIKK